MKYLVLLLLASVPSLAQPSFEIAWSTYLGGSQYDDLREIIPLADGSLLVGGQTMSDDFPATPGSLQSRYGGEPAGTGHPGVVGGDAFVARLSGDGAKILAATFFGGSRQERDVYGMALDSRGDILITTTTRSADIPTTPGALQPKFAGGASDIIVAKLSADLSRTLWCTYLGGRGDETPRGGLAIDSTDHLYIVGTTSSPDFPVTPGVVQSKPGGNYSALVTKLKPDGAAIAWSTLLGGDGNNGIIGARVDAKGNVHVHGHSDGDLIPVSADAPQPKRAGRSDCFVAALSPDAGKILHATWLGGAQQEFAEHRLALLDDGSVILTGVTGSADFPTTPAAFQPKLRGRTNGFVTRLAADGKKWHFSTFLGGSEGEYFLMPTLDTAGNIYVVGHTASKDFPVTANALQPKFGGGSGDGVFAILSPDGSKLLYATYIGGAGEDLLRSLALLPNGDLVLIGKTASDDFLKPTPTSAQPRRKGQVDAFLLKLTPAR